MGVDHGYYFVHFMFPYIPQLHQEIITYLSLHYNSKFYEQTFSTHFSPVFHFCNPWKRQKTKSFQESMEMEHLLKWAKTG